MRFGIWEHFSWEFEVLENQFLDDESTEIETELVTVEETEESIIIEEA